MHVLLILLLMPIFAYASGPTILYDNIVTGKKSGVEAAKAYVASRAGMMSGSGNLSGLDLIRKQPSLLGTHYYFQQRYKGIPIEDAEIIVSVRDKDAAIYRVFDNALPKVSLFSTDDRVRLNDNEAYDIAWKDLGVTGPLMSRPSVKLVYQSSKGQLDLVYKIKLAVSEPFGYWQYTVSASSGKILKKEDIRISESAKGAKTAKHKATGALLDRMEAFAEYDSKQLVYAFETIEEGTNAVADGKALVFDPDPRTALNDSTLQDNSPAEKFEPAYVNRVLKDLTLSNNQYSLKGPWVQIQDFEPPTNAPTTTTDGNWNFKRGNNAFNDAMTYFHIDQNQRYMQSLGFVGAKGIQNLSIKVDSDGVSGDDNSHFVPGENRVAFGHGCVDDNEDADVILHEYGHAIQHAIGSNWHGGDTGAMGEGFGDYWAGSYSLSTVNGTTFLPDTVFHWDGNPCWPGRRLNVLDAQYQHSRTYSAHQSMGGFESDELWSTPLFQSLRELISLGYPRERVDQIILEAHFGLGANLKMRDMATSILQTAQRLYPSDAYATVFQKHFVHHNIIEVPHAVLETKQIELRSAGDNNVLDPGETVDLYVTLKNSGTSAARLLNARVSSQNPNVTLNGGTVSFGDLAPGAQGANANPISLGLSRNATCGSEVELVLDLTFEGGAVNTAKLAVKLPTGVAKVAGGAAEHNPPLAIPDNDTSGVQSSIWLNDEGTITQPKGVSVSLEILHSFIGDLKVSLISPSGKQVLLHNKEGGNDANLVGTYPTTLVPAESFTKLAGELLKGEWKIKAVDSAAYDKGTLNKWGLQIVSGYQCAAPPER